MYYHLYWVRAVYASHQEPGLRVQNWDHPSPQSILNLLRAEHSTHKNRFTVEMVYFSPLIWATACWLVVKLWKQLSNYCSEYTVTVHYCHYGMEGKHFVPFLVCTGLWTSNIKFWKGFSSFVGTPTGLWVEQLQSSLTANIHYLILSLTEALWLWAPQYVNNDLVSVEWCSLQTAK